MPTDHKVVIARVHRATPELVKEAITGAIAAREDWSRKPLYFRQAIMLKASDLLAGKYRMATNAATMMGQVSE